MCYSLYFFCTLDIFLMKKKNKSMSLFTKVSGKIWLEDILEIHIWSLKINIPINSVILFVGISFKDMPYKIKP